MGNFSLLTINLIPTHKEIFITIILLGLAAGGTISNLISKKTAYLFGINIIAFYAIKIWIENKEGTVLFLVALIFFYVAYYKNGEIL